MYLNNFTSLLYFIYIIVILISQQQIFPYRKIKQRSPAEYRTYRIAGYRRVEKVA